MEITRNDNRPDSEKLIDAIQTLIYCQKQGATIKTFDISSGTMIRPFEIFEIMTDSKEEERTFSIKITYKWKKP